MTTSELISTLQQLPPNSLIVTRGYEGGVTSNVSPTITEVALNVNTAWYYGEHERIGDESDRRRYAGEHTIVPAILL